MLREAVRLPSLYFQHLDVLVYDVDDRQKLSLSRRVHICLYIYVCIHRFITVHNKESPTIPTREQRLSCLYRVCWGTSFAWYSLLFTVTCQEDLSLNPQTHKPPQNVKPGKPDL